MVIHDLDDLGVPHDFRHLKINHWKHQARRGLTISCHKTHFEGTATHLHRKMFGGFRSSGWWLSHPSEKYDFVSCDDEIPNIYIYICGKIKNVPNHPPDVHCTLFISTMLFHHASTYLMIFMHKVCQCMIGFHYSDLLVFLLDLGIVGDSWGFLGW